MDFTLEIHIHIILKVVLVSKNAISHILHYYLLCVLNFLCSKMFGGMLRLNTQGRSHRKAVQCNYGQGDDKPIRIRVLLFFFGGVLAL